VHQKKDQAERAQRGEKGHQAQGKEADAEQAAGERAGPIIERRIEKGDELERRLGVDRLPGQHPPHMVEHPPFHPLQLEGVAQPGQGHHEVGREKAEPARQGQTAQEAHGLNGSG